MPLCAGNGGQGLLQRRHRTEAESVTGRAAPPASGAERAGDGGTARLDGDATERTQDRAELRTRESHSVHAPALDAFDAVPARGGGSAGQQRGGTSPEESHPAP